MNDNSTYYTDLIAWYFSGEISEDELRLLSEWLTDSDQNKETFRQYQQTWQLIEKQNIGQSVNLDSEWKAMQEKINAAHPNDNSAGKVITMLPNTFANALQKIWKVAAVAVILLVSGFMLFQYLSKPTTVVITAQAGNLEQMLPDGSVISLHKGSQITYPSKFTGGTRNVELSGKAYFKVSHDKTRPFIVSSGNARIEVLGTQFNVNTVKAPGTMEVVLTSGKVSVYYAQKPKENVVLMPGEKAVLNATQNQIRKSSNADANYMAWKTHVLVFEDKTLAEVITTLEDVYQVPVSLTDERLAGCRVTASFNAQSLTSVLQVLKETLSLNITQTGNNIEISGKGCL
jgi:ferric-dicitrate binding protein FerR (iron transport regulator)